MPIDTTSHSMMTDTAIAVRSIALLSTIGLRPAGGLLLLIGP